jgi:sugar phosphate permease
MATTSAEGVETVTDNVIERETIRRISLRLLPMLFLLYLFAYIDRTNVGIAALQMNGELNFSPATFGFGAGISWFFLAIPLAQAASGPLGGALLGLAGVWHLSGWQWLFLIEGIPSVLLGTAVLRYLTERPQDARWLSAEQRNWLTQRIQQERQQLPRSFAREDPAPAYYRVARGRKSRLSETVGEGVCPEGFNGSVTRHGRIGHPLFNESRL